MNTRLGFLNWPEAISFLDWDGGDEIDPKPR